MEKNTRTNEIDVIALFKRIIKNKKQIGFVFLFSALLGVVVALATPKQYTAEVILAPEITSGGVGISESLGEMVSSFGIDLGSKSSIDAIYPEIYPSLFASNDFILKLFDIQVQLLDDSITKTYLAHLEQDTPIPFWNYPSVWISSLISEKEDVGHGTIDTYHLSKHQESIVSQIRGSIACLVDKKTNIITLTATDFDRQVAAILADTLQNRLQNYITDYRTKKAKHDLAYAEKLYEEAKIQYLQAQQAYASYADATQKLVLQSHKAKRDQLVNELQLKYNIYTQCTQQLQAARAKVQEKTPVFTIIQQATVPNKASSMPRSYIVFFFLILGFATYILWILYLHDIWLNRNKH